MFVWVHPGGDGVDPNVGGEFRGRLLGQLDDAALRGDVGGDAGPLGGHVAENRRGGDDASLVHRGGGLPDRVEDAVEVDVHHLVPLLERIAVDREAQPADAGVGEDDVEAAERGLRLLDHRGHLLGVGDVDRHGLRVGLETGGDRLEPLGVDVRQCEVGIDVRTGLRVALPCPRCRTP